MIFYTIRETVIVIQHVFVSPANKRIYFKPHSATPISNNSIKSQLFKKLLNIRSARAVYFFVHRHLGGGGEIEIVGK